MESGGLGKVYGDGEIIVRQGEQGDCMYVIQEGRVEVIREKDGKEISLAILGEREFFGEVPLFERERRSATVRVLGEARLLTVDRKTLMRRIQEDPSLAYRMLQTLSRRVRALDAELANKMLDHPDREKVGST